MRRLQGSSIVTVAMVGAAMVGAAMAGTAMAGPFDGNWIGQIPPSGTHCRHVALMTITVSGDTVAGVIHNPANQRPFTGEVDADGNAAFQVTGFYSGTIKFTAEHFDANWDSGNCKRHSLGDRAPDAAQSAALVAERAHAQATYDELTEKAAAGDRSVNYTALRAAYPFTQQWDFSSYTTGPLMEQANAAAKGKDCPTALEKVEEVLKVDYTLIDAHRVRSDCLKGSASHIESRIADGLLDSLKIGGNGRSESTAYPVMTDHEEHEILHEKHIILKTRDTAVRGSNGRFYDVVHGISVWNGVRVDDVYFDVTAQVKGRSSGLAAADASNTTLSELR
jgi:hypothetical protein